MPFKITVFYYKTYLNVNYFCENKAECLAAITPVFSATWSEIILVCLTDAQKKTTL